MINCVLVRYVEIFIKRGNKAYFESLLIAIIKKRLKDTSDFEIVKEQSRILIQKTGENFDYQYICEQLKKVSGINVLSPCIKTSITDIENIRNLSINHMREFYGEKNLTFKVETKRVNKKYFLKSYDVCYDIGGCILGNMTDLKVDVHNPDVTLNIEIRNDIYIYSQNILGLAGLPYGSSGLSILLLSGGIDSPVAGYLMANRGVGIEATYYHSPPYTSELALEKVKDLCEALCQFVGTMKLHVINFTETQLYINDNVDKNKTTIFLKRSMLRCSEKIAQMRSAKALVVGDSIGQVASQTLDSIFVIDTAVTTPILRPLAAMDKERIKDIAMEIGTYDISIRPYEDCCTVFVPEHPDLKPSKKVVELTHERLTELEALLDKAISTREIFEF